MIGDPMREAALETLFRIGAFILMTGAVIIFIAGVLANIPALLILAAVVFVPAVFLNIWAQRL